MKLNPGWIATLGLFCITTCASATSMAAPDATCSGSAQLITIPEGTAEASFLLTCPNVTLPSSVAAHSAVFLDADGNISDFVAFTQVGTTADFLFTSDLDTGGPPLTPPTPVFTTVTEPNPVIVISTSGTVQFTFKSDLNDTPGEPSETIAIAILPEPASLTLAGLGGLLLLCGRFMRSRTSR